MMAGDLILLLAWTGAIAWPAFTLLALWLGLRKGRGPGPIGWLALGLISCAWFFGVWAFLWEPQQLVIRRIETTAETWSGPALRIGIISDTHTDGPHMSLSRLSSVVQQMNAEQPDIVLLLGDFVAGFAARGERSQAEQAAIAQGLQAFSALRAPLGVHAVLGNHDWAYDGSYVEAQLRAAGVNVMENDRRLITRPGGAFWLGGLADYESQRTQPSYSITLGDQEGRLPVSPAAPVIVMSHWPDAFAVAPGSVALTLAGHSHCGAVNLPFFGRLAAASDGSRRWPCGLYEERGGKLYVSGGLGVSILPVRFRQPPEITVLTLRGV